MISMHHKQLQWCCNDHLHADSHTYVTGCQSSCSILSNQTCLSKSTVPEGLGSYSNSNCLISCQPNNEVLLPYLSYSCSDSRLVTSVLPLEFPSKSYNCIPCNCKQCSRNLQHPSKTLYYLDIVRHWKMKHDTNYFFVSFDVCCFLDGQCAVLG